MFCDSQQVLWVSVSRYHESRLCQLTGIGEEKHRPHIHHSYKYNYKLIRHNLKRVNPTENKKVPMLILGFWTFQAVCVNKNWKICIFLHHIWMVLLKATMTNVFTR